MTKSKKLQRAIWRVRMDGSSEVIIPNHPLRPTPKKKRRK